MVSSGCRTGRRPRRSSTSASMYYRNEGVAQDYAEAAVWYRRAAEAGHANAQFNLGYMYNAGEGVPQDYTEALAWYRRAAEAGHARAQVNLGGMYHRGEGVAQDYAEALAWYRRAAEQGDARAQSSLGGMYYKGEGVPQDYILAYMWFNLAGTNGPKNCLRFVTWWPRRCPRPRSPKPSTCPGSGGQRIGPGRSSTERAAEGLTLLHYD